jgi:hypothetical protein
MGIKTQEKLELSTSYPQKVDNFTLTITFHIDVWVNPQLAEMLIFLDIFNIFGLTNRVIMNIIEMMF